MSYFQRPADGGEEPSGHDVEQATIEGPAPSWAQEPGPGSWADDDDDAAGVGVGARMTHFRERVRGALAGLDLGQVGRPTFPPADPDATEAFDVLDEVPAVPVQAPPSRFAVAPLGYSRAAVDEHVAALEREIAELREQRQDEPPAISVTEEIERLGEQTASILVVAHDKAHETTRLAHEQAERCITDAADNAVAITDEAKRRLESMDAETDVVWQERSRLLEDARAVATELAALVDRAEARFPEELKTADVEG